MFLRTGALIFVLVPFAFAGNIRLSTSPVQPNFTPELEPISENNELKTSTFPSKLQLESNSKNFEQNYANDLNKYSPSMWTPERMRREQKFLGAAKVGDIKAMYEAVESGPIFDAHFGEALMLACRHGHDLVLKFLGELFTIRIPTEFMVRSLYAIAEHNHARLLPLHFIYFGNIVPKEAAIIAIGVASKYKNIAVVMGLLELYDFRPNEISLIAELYVVSAFGKDEITK